MAEAACAAMEERLTNIRPDLLPGAEEYASVLRARIDHDHDHHDAHHARHPFKARA